MCDVPSINVNGLDLFYADDDFADPWRPHDAILMQHWVLGNHTQFRGWVPQLAREFRVIRMDRRGHGDSAKPPVGYQYCLADLLSDMEGLLDALGIERMHYVGASLGGMLGAFFAAAHPDRVKSLVLCGTPSWIKPVTQNGFARGGYADGVSSVQALGSFAWAYHGWTAARSSDATVWDELRNIYYAQQTAKMPAHVIASLMRMVSQRDFDITPILGEIQAPTLLLTPEASIHTSMDEQAMMKERIPDCEQVVFAGASHQIAADIPERCAEATLAFLRQHTN